MISAKVIADSINPAGVRLTTVEAVFNRWILAESNTHRMLSRNSASSRAIPVKRILKEVWKNPAYPVQWGSNKAGMQAGAELAGWRKTVARFVFLKARFPILVVVWLLSKVGLHKQVANRLLEPWMWQTAIFSATEWENFFKLRNHKDAQPEFQVLAGKIDLAMSKSHPELLKWGEWHLPYIDKQIDTRLSHEAYATVSAACCARVSYVRQNNRKSDEEDAKLAEKLSSSGHFSPFEHPAQAVEGYHGGNFGLGWKQLRKNYKGESGVSEVNHECTCKGSEVYSDDCMVCHNRKKK